MSRFRNKSEKMEAREKMCFNKKRYMSIESATGASSFMLKQFDSEQFPYRCKNCNLYHLSTTVFHDNKLSEEADERNSQT